MSPIRICLLLALVAQAVAAAPVKSVDADFQQVKIDGQITSAAIDPATGDVALLDADKDLLLIYPKMAGGSAPPESVAIGHGATQVVHKSFGGKSYFAVLQTTPPGIAVVDVAERKIVNNLTVTGNPTCLAAAADAACPFLFYAGSHDSQNPGTYISTSRAGRVDIATGVNTVLQSPPTANQMLVGKLAAAPDGSYLYAGDNYSSNVMVAKVDDAAKTPAVRWNSVADSSGVTAVDPAGAVVAIGSLFVTPDLASTVGQFQSVPTAGVFLPGRPIYAVITWAGTVANSRLSFESTTTYRTLAQATLPNRQPEGGNDAPAQPQPYHPNNRRPQSNGPTLGLLADTGHDAVILWTTDAAYVIPLKPFDLPTEPVVSARLVGSHDWVTGRPGSMKVVPTDPKAKVTVDHGPAGLKVDGNDLDWTPGPADVGVVDAAVRISVGSSSAVLPFTMQIDRPSIPLPFEPNAMAVSSDGKTAVVASGTVFRQTPYNGGEPAPPELAVVDLAAGKVVARRVVGAIGEMLAVDGDHVFAASHSSAAVHVLSAADLSESSRIFTNGPINSVTVVPGNDLFVTTDVGPGTMIRLSDLAIDTKPTRIGRGGVRPQPIAGGWYYQGVLWDAALAKPRLLVRPDGFRISVGYGPAAGLAPAVNTSIFPWGGPIVTASQAVSLDYNRGGVPILVGDMMISNIVMTNGSARSAVNRPTTARRSNLAQGESRSVCLMELRRGPSTANAVIFDRPAPPPGSQENYGYGGYARPIAVSDDAIVVAVDKHLYRIPRAGLPAIPDPPDGPPPRFEPDQSVFVVDAEKPTTIPCRVTGIDPKSSPRFDLTSDTRGVDIDHATGTVTIDPKAVVPAAVDQLAAGLAMARRYLPTPDAAARTIDDSVADYQSTTRDLFTKLTGRPPAGYPVTVNIGVGVHAAENRAAAIERVVLLDLPVDAVAAAVRRQPVIAGTRSADDRVADLERRNAELQGQVDLLKQMLEKPTTRP